jgi:hypothetical protein
LRLVLAFRGSGLDVHFPAGVFDVDEDLGNFEETEGNRFSPLTTKKRGS